MDQKQIHDKGKVCWENKTKQRQAECRDVPQWRSVAICTAVTRAFDTGGYPVGDVLLCVRRWEAAPNQRPVFGVG